jgi:hypothetical protein
MKLNATHIQEINSSGYGIAPATAAGPWTVSAPAGAQAYPALNEFLANRFETVTAAYQAAYTHYLAAKIAGLYPQYFVSLEEKSTTGFCDDPEVAPILIALSIEGESISGFFESNCLRFALNPEMEYQIQIEHAILLNQHNGIAFDLSCIPT